MLCYFLTTKNMHIDLFMVVLLLFAKEKKINEKKISQAQMPWNF